MDAVMVEWLQSRNMVDEVQTVVESNGIAVGDMPAVLGWLAAAGVDTHAVVRELENFYAGYRAVDGLMSQGVLILFWYVNRQHTRVAGVNLLLDFNPPWEGCIKDVLPLAQVDLKDVHREFLAIWEGQGLTFEELDAIEAKRALIDLLAVNREQGIRLQQDIQPLRDDLIRHVFSLRDDPETPSFTSDDFDYVIGNGRPAETIMLEEQAFGRRVRLDGDKEILVQDLRDDWDDDEWDDDE